MNKAEAFFKHITGVSPKSTYRISEDECIELMQKYADKQMKLFADFINENYYEADDTFSIYDWIEEFNQQNKE